MSEIIFKDLVFKPTTVGIQAKMFFDNGYGLSVVKGIGSYGYEDNLYEMAVIKGTENDWEICDDTPITDDVLGRLTEYYVTKYMREVQLLPKAK